MVGRLDIDDYLESNFIVVKNEISPIKTLYTKPKSIRFQGNHIYDINLSRSVVYSLEKIEDFLRNFITDENDVACMNGIIIPNVNSEMEFKDGMIFDSKTLYHYCKINPLMIQLIETNYEWVKKVGKEVKEKGLVAASESYQIII